MQRKFVSSLLFVLFLNLLVKPFWIFGIDVTVQNRVGAEEYGLYYPIFGFSILLNIILDFGITNYNNRNIAQHAHMLGRYFSGIFNVKLFLGVFYMLTTLLLGYFVGYDSKALYLLFILGINQFLNSMILYLRSNLTGLHLFKTEGIMSVMDRLIMIVICSALLWGGFVDQEFQIEWFVYAQFVAYFITALVAFVLVLSKAQFFKPKLNFAIFKIILRESLPFALLVLLMSFYYRLDSVMIERLLPNGKLEAGIYAQAYRILEGFNMFGYLFAGILLPLFTRMIKEKLKVDKLVNTAFTVMFIPAVAAAIVAVLHPLEIMDFLYKANIQESSEVFAVLMLCFVAIALTYIYGTLLTANGSLKALNIISLSGLLINFGLNLYLIPRKGAYGAAIATLVTQTVVVILQIVISKSMFKMKYSLSFLLRISSVLVLGIITAFYTTSIISNFLLHGVLILVTFGFLALVSGLVSKAELLAFVKNKS